MQWQTGVAIAISPLLAWLARKAMSPLVRHARSLPEGRLRRLLLWGDDKSGQ